VWKLSIPAILHDDLSGIEALRRLFFGNGGALKSFNDIDDQPDSIMRLLKCLFGIADPHTFINKYINHLPYNPGNKFILTTVLGEFIDCCVDFQSETYKFEAEHISHHPPISAFTITGPKFILQMDAAKLDGLNSVKLGLNSLDISFPKSKFVLKTEGGHQLEWVMLGYRTENIMSPKRIVNY
jgi:hypothetical protein